MPCLFFEGNQLGFSDPSLDRFYRGSEANSVHSEPPMRYTIVKLGYDCSQI